jgi:hypothetical protein
MPNTRKRFAAVSCPKCLKVDLSEVWCRPTEEFCDPVDQERRVSFFIDAHHANLYGSMFVGQFLRNKYDEWLEMNK